MTTRRLLPLLVVLPLLAAGCSAPEKPLELGFKEVPTDVVLGAQSSPTPITTAGPVAPPTLPPPPGVIALPPAPFEPIDRPPSEPAPPLPTPPSDTCDKADPLQAPAVEAPATIAAPPAARQYVFRNVGSFEVSGADARKGTFPERSVRSVGNVVRDTGGGGFAFDVAEVIADVTTTTTYRVVPPSTAPTAAVSGGALLVQKVVSTRPGDEPAEFNPVPSLQLAALPLVRGAVVQARGVDPVTATTMSFTSTVAGKARVDACGDPLDSFVLELTEGTVVSPSVELTFEATYFVGTQYGGLILADKVAYAGEESGVGTSRTNTATISSTPAKP